MAVYSHFNLNSDYTSIKEVQNFTISMTVPKQSVAAGGGTYDYYQDIYVPAGAFIEHVNLYWSYSKDTTPSSTLIINETYHHKYDGIEYDGTMQTAVFLYRVNATTYRLRHMVYNIDDFAHNAGGYTITAKAHLFTTSG